MYTGGEIMRLQESGEMYLETILILSNKLEHVRSLDVAGHMGYSKPSVSRAVNLLKNAGYLTMDPTGYLTLTDSGLAIAEKIYERHNILAKFFISLGVDQQTAFDDACKIEHYISDITFEKIKQLVKN